MNKIEVQCVYCGKKNFVSNDKEGGICRCSSCHGMFKYEYKPKFGERDIPVLMFLKDNESLFNKYDPQLKDKITSFSYNFDRMSEIWDKMDLSEEDRIFILKCIDYGKKDEEKINIRKIVWKTIYPIFYFEKNNKKNEIRRYFLNRKMKMFPDTNTFITKLFNKIMDLEKKDPLSCVDLSRSEIIRYIPQKRYEIGERNFPANKLRRNYLPSIKNIINNPFI